MMGFSSLLLLLLVLILSEAHNDDVAKRREERKKKELMLSPVNITELLEVVTNAVGGRMLTVMAVTCWDDEVPQVNCSKRFFDGVNFNTEEKFIDSILDICSYSISRLSPHGSPYNNGHNSLIDCMRLEQQGLIKLMIHQIYQTDTELNRRVLPLVEFPPYPGCAVNWMWFLAAFETSQHSQAGQDGVLDEIFRVIGITSNPYYVEIGYNRPYLTEGSNTLFLLEKGWDGLLIDGEHENQTINLHAHFVTPENIVRLFEQYHVPLEPDYVSVDIDSIDVWVARSLLQSNYRPRVVSIEYNSNFPIGASVAMPPVSDDPVSNTWNGFDVYYGSSAGSIKKMAEEVGYEVVHFVGTFDIILIRKDLLGGECPPPYAMFANRVIAKQHCVVDSARRGHWIEYSTWIRTGGNSELSRQAALHQLLSIKGIDAGPRSSPACLGVL